MKIKCFIFFFFPLSISLVQSQTLEGTTGLFFIPTAEMQNDGQILVGVNYIDKSLVSFGGYAENAFTPFMSFTFLPFLEFGGKITRLINSHVTTQGIGDRTVSMRLQVCHENEIMPSVLIGLHDLGGIYGGVEAVHNNALYIVASKNFYLKSNSFTSFSIHGGYGTDWIRANTHNFVGLFGGIDFEFYNTLEVMAEYDGTHTNGGLRVKLFDHISLLGGWLRWKYFSGGAGVSFGL